MKKQTAVIVIDTGFSCRSLMNASGNILAAYDLSIGQSWIGDPFLDFEKNGDELRQFAGDPLDHGSIVLNVLLDQTPETPVVLIRAYSDDVRLIRTGFSNGQISSPGWIEAYAWAVELCKERGYNTVANCSFGGYTHAMDGSGWEAHSLRQVIGKDKPGHIVVAGAGSGNGQSIHSSWSTNSGESTDVVVDQKTSTTYNFWAGLGEEVSSNWTLEVFLNGDKVGDHQSEWIAANFWNNRKQLTFTVDGVGEVRFRLTNTGKRCRFDCWINHQDDACFVSHSDANLIAEPAVFPEVIAVGLAGGKYAANQTEVDAKPEVLLEGGGPVSFRLPEVVARVAGWLQEDPTLDSESVKQRLIS